MRRLLLLSALACSAALIVPVLGQDAVITGTEAPSWLKQVLDMLLPTLLTAAGGILLLIINSLAGFVKDKFGIDIEARHREALHSALLTGMRLALVRLGWVPGTEVPARALTMAVDYAHNSVPDAIDALGPGDATLVKMAESKATVATAEIAASGPTSVTVSGEAKHDDHH